MLAHERKVDRHADRHEEQPEQDAAERLDIGLELVAEVRLGEEKAGEERAHRHREADFLHQRRGAEHHEERRGRHDFAGAAAGQNPEQPVQAVTADQHDGDDGGEGLADDEKGLGQGTLGRCPGRGEQRQKGEDRDDRDILEEQDREGALAIGRLHVVALAEHLQRDRGRRKAQREADHDGSMDRHAQRGRAAAEQNRRDAKLSEAEPEDVPSHRPEIRQLELQADDEEKEHDAELRNRRRGFGVPDEPKPGGPDRDAGREVAEHGAEAEEAKQRNRHHSGAAEGENRGKEARVGSGARHGTHLGVREP